MVKALSCFKAYDIRGVVPDELDEELAYRIAGAYAAFVSPRIVALGRDVRPSGAALVDALTKGLNDAGVDVVDIGICGTEEVYFAVAHLGLDGGIMVTASHNPPEYNGMKLVRRGAVPISGDSGLKDIEALALAGPPQKRLGGSRKTVDVRDAYIDHLIQYVRPDALEEFTFVANPGNGCAGPIIERLEQRLPFRFASIHAEPDGGFPNGVPNPLLQENRAPTAQAVVSHGAHMGIAWDGDFDRCFFFDETGAFVEGYYIVGLLARAMLRTHPGATIIHDPRLVWDTVEIIEAEGGRPVQSKSGHAFIKERMRAEDAAYGGEVSAHHYFRDFFYCDSGMIPWLLIADLLSREGRPLSALIAERARLFPVSGEINRRLDDAEGALRRIEERYVNETAQVDRTDGLSVAFPRWRFNVRLSNTEPLLRLNVESRGDKALMEAKTEEVLAVIDG